MKIPYSFSVLRYIHDVVTGEFANVGVVLFAPEAKFLSAICTSKYGRLSAMFEGVKGEHIKGINRYLQARLEEEGDKMKTRLPLEKMPVSVNEFTAKILPIDDSSFQFSSEGIGLTSDPHKTLEELFERYVERYGRKVQKISRTDEEVWRTFKKPFEEKSVLAYLKPYQIVAKNFEHEFKYSWKNGKWQVLEPLSFDLVERSSIIDKAHTWFGKATSLSEGTEEFKLILLLGSPKEENMRVDFIKAQNILNKMPCEHEFIKEDEAEDFAEKLKKEIEAHN